MNLKKLTEIIKNLPKNNQGDCEFSINDYVMIKYFEQFVYVYVKNQLYGSLKTGFSKDGDELIETIKDHLHQCIFNYHQNLRKEQDRIMKELLGE